MAVLALTYYKLAARDHRIQRYSESVHNWTISGIIHQYDLAFHLLLLTRETTLSLTLFILGIEKQKDRYGNHQHNIQVFGGNAVNVAFTRNSRTKVWGSFNYEHNWTETVRVSEYSATML